MLAAWIQAPLAQVRVPLPVVRVESGQLAGKVLTSGVKAWLGIPYAQHPVRDLRWKAPQPITWQGVYNADRKMPACIQILRPHDINHYFGEEATGEDCLFMNVWAPETATPASKLPVIVFLYGGGNTVGSSGMALYGGEQVARRGAVFVNFNYRLGILGFMAHPELTQESGVRRRATGRTSIRWRRCGGSSATSPRSAAIPTQVVIAGQSAGAGAVSLLQASPLAKGLFRGVVAMSGGTWGNGGTGGIPRRSRARRPAGADRDQVRVAGRDAERAGRSAAGAAGGEPAGRDRRRADPRGPEHRRVFPARNARGAVCGASRQRRPGNRRFRQRRELQRVAQHPDSGRVHGAGAPGVRRARRRVPATLSGEDRRRRAEAAKTAAREAGVLRTARNWAVAQAAVHTSPTYLYNLVHVHPFNRRCSPIASIRWGHITRATCPTG